MEKINTLIKKYRKYKIKLTPQRLAILETVRSLFGKHPSAEDVFSIVHRKYPTMSLTTVYKTLDKFVELGELVEINFDPIKKRYDSILRPHNHIICIKCYKIMDVFENFDHNTTKKFKGFSIIGQSKIYYGLCNKCSTNSNRS